MALAAGVAEFSEAIHIRLPSTIGNLVHVSTTTRGCLRRYPGVFRTVAVSTG